MISPVQVVTGEHRARRRELVVAQRVGGDDLGFEFDGLAGRCGEPQGEGEGGEAERDVQHGAVTFLGRCFCVVTI